MEEAEEGVGEGEAADSLTRVLQSPLGPLTAVGRPGRLKRKAFQVLHNHPVGATLD